MKILSGMHNHTDFSDGQNTMEEMVVAAIDKGFLSIGISDHGPAKYDPDCAIPESKVDEYFGEISRLKEKYGDKIEMYCGFESDMLNPFDKEKLDYAIGSVHYVVDKKTGEKFCIDYLDEDYETAIEVVGQGDIKRLVRSYYDIICDTAENYRPEIIGHIDLISKLNEKGKYFDPKAQWYKEIVRDTLERIKTAGDSIIELNTSGWRIDHRNEPYPSKDILKMICEMNIPVTISADSHSAENIDYRFEDAVALLKEIGFSEVMQWHGREFERVMLRD